MQSQQAPTHSPTQTNADSPTPPADLPATLGELRQSGWQDLPVKEELRRNLVAAIAQRSESFPRIYGYEDTVIPALEHALLACHDVIFLGERGQAKTRIIRSLTNLLDEWLPAIAGCELHDSPYNPVSALGKELLAEHGENTELVWIHRRDRFAEKLATPDTSIADLIGEVDPIKVAEGRYLSDELTMHYGLVPRAHRGVFAINELPDLAERIQVGLLNVLEERDVQIRGYRIRLPLDLLLVASANPEDYTNRGRIITPLKDRFGSQIRTHYPRTTDIEIDIVEQEAHPFADDNVAVRVPDFMAEITAGISQEARLSPHVNQRSGVSVRLSVANYEMLVSAAVRRALLQGEALAVPRMCDLEQLSTSMAGKVELDTLDEDRDTEVFEHLTKTAVLGVFRDTCDPGDCLAVAEAFTEDISFGAGDAVPAEAYAQLVQDMPELAQALRGLGYEADDLAAPALVASGVEFILEGLHLSKRLNKDVAALGEPVIYQGKAKPRPVGEDAAPETMPGQKPQQSKQQQPKSPPPASPSQN